VRGYFADLRNVAAVRLAGGIGGEPVTFEAPIRIGYAESQSTEFGFATKKMCHGVHWAFIVS
jgi:hypothetical protein